MKLILTALLIGRLTLTAYRSVPEQTKADPFHTATGEHTTIRGCAVSQDLLKINGGPIEYGDLLYIEGIGFRFCNDCMNKRHHNAVDIWVQTQEDEHKIFKRFKNGKTQVYLIKGVLK